MKNAPSPVLPLLAALAATVPLAPLPALAAETPAPDPLSAPVPPAGFVLLDEGVRPGAWTHDWNAALAESRRSGRPVFALFTGSDWCPACRDLHDIVFRNPAWPRWAAENVVLAWVDHPRDAALVPERHRARSEMLLMMYGIEAFPTCLLLPPGSMRPAAELGFRSTDTVASFIRRAARMAAPLRRPEMPDAAPSAAPPTAADSGTAPDVTPPSETVKAPLPSAPESGTAPPAPPGMRVVCEGDVCRLVPDDGFAPAAVAEAAPPVAASLAPADSLSPDAPESVPMRTPESVPMEPANSGLFPGFRLRKSAMGGMTAPELAAWLAAESVPNGAEGTPRPGNGLSRRGAAALLAAAFLGGILLNFSPCVLPMIPVTLAVLGAGAARRRRGALLGAAYGLGIAAAYGALGILCLTTGRAFGTLQSSPWFNLAAAVLLLAFALSLLGVLPIIDFTRFAGGASGAASETRAGGLAAAFGAGVGFALLAGACVAPVMLGTLVAAVSLQAEGNALGFALPFVLGAGCGAPWVLLGAGLARWLPRPGAWMRWVERLFGILLIALAVHYAALAIPRLAGASREGADGAASSDVSIAWRTDPGFALAEARDTGRPLFVYAWATWCRSCGAMSRTTFRDPVAAAALEGYIPLKVQCEDPSDPAVDALFDAFHIGVPRGLPAFAVFDLD